LDQDPGHRTRLVAVRDEKKRVEGPPTNSGKSKGHYAFVY